MWPSANIAVVTGAISNLVVVDIDGDRERGFDLLRRNGIEFPATRMVQTGRGGVHLWFAHPGVFTPSPGAVLKDGDLHIDVRGDGGYALVPPSLHENGQQYRFIEPFKRPLPVLPEAMVRLLEKKQHRTARPTDDGKPTQNNTVQKILADVSIEQVIQGHGVALAKQSPDCYRGLCPFHEDTKPSFVVTPSKGLFHCFGCNAAGNAIQFVQKIRGIGFAEATRFLR
jgi:hypothetical protein